MRSTGHTGADAPRQAALWLSQTSSITTELPTGYIYICGPLTREGAGLPPPGRTEFVQGQRPLCPAERVNVEELRSCTHGHTHNDVTDTCDQAKKSSRYHMHLV